MENIGQYSDVELSLRFANEKPLYVMRRDAISRDSWQDIKDYCDARYKYRPEQMQILRNDFVNDRREYVKEIVKQEEQDILDATM